MASRPRNSSWEVVGDIELPADSRNSIGPTSVGASALEESRVRLGVDACSLPPQSYKDGGSIPNPGLKWISLCLLVLQSVSYGLCYRYARIIPGPSWLTSSVVVNSELLKLIISLAIAMRESRASGAGIPSLFHRLFWTEVSGTLVMCVPGVLYTAQNVLYMVGISNLSASMYNVTKQANLLTTAVLSVLILKKRLSRDKWFAIVLLVLGGVRVNTNGDTSVKGTPEVGLVSTLVATWLTGLSGVVTEVMIKRPSFTIWERNIQLSLCGVLFGTCGLLLEWRDQQWLGEYLQGYKPEVWLVVVLQAVGGMVTAAVLKFADNVIKCVVKGVALVISIFCSRLIFNEGPELTSPMLASGVTLVVVATSLYTLGAEPLVGLISCRRGGYARTSDLKIFSH